jgi:hypothetical protein
VSTAGYSGTPLAKKLGIKEGSRVLLVDAPRGFSVDLPEGAKIVRSAKADVDVAEIFSTERAKLLDRFLEAAAVAKKEAGIWIAWPKKASKVATDVTENVLREDLLPTGFVDNKVCAIDERWSGLRFVLRRSAR